MKRILIQIVGIIRGGFNAVISMLWFFVAWMIFANLYTKYLVSPMSDLFPVIFAYGIACFIWNIYLVNKEFKEKEVKE